MHFLQSTVHGVPGGRKGNELLKALVMFMLCSANIAFLLSRKTVLFDMTIILVWPDIKTCQHRGCMRCDMEYIEYIKHNKALFSSTLNP